VAAGLRPLGKGAWSTSGIKSAPAAVAVAATTAFMVDRVLAWAKVSRIHGASRRRAVPPLTCNNGLYDVWTLWNQRRDQPVQTRFVFRDGTQPVSVVDVLTGQPVDLSADLNLARSKTKILLTPRGHIETAPLEWFKLQTQLVAWYQTTRQTRAGAGRRDGRRSHQ